MELQTKLNLSVSRTKHTILNEAQSTMHPLPEPPQSIRFGKNFIFSKLPFGISRHWGISRYKRLSSYDRTRH